MQVEEAKTTNAMKPPKKKKWVLVLVIVLLISAVVAVIVLWQTGVLNSVFRDKNILGTVNGKNITKQDVEKISKDMTSAGFFEEEKSQTLELIMDYWLYTLAAKKYGIEVSDKDALDYLKSQLAGSGLDANLNMGNDYVRYRAYRDYLRDELETQIRYPQKGAYIVAHFDQNFDKNNTEPKTLSSQQYDVLVKADRDYATKFINDVYSKIKSGSITFEQGMQLQLQDKVIGQEALPTAVQSQSFGSKQPANGTYLEPISNNPQVKLQIEKLQAGQISEPFIIKVPPGQVPSNDLVDGIWMIVKLDAINSKLPKFESISAALESLKKEYGYAVYK